jgi:hypothetical protein
VSQVFLHMQDIGHRFRSFASRSCAANAELGISAIIRSPG